MTAQRPLLFVYRQLLRLYPLGFRERFAEEMLETAESAGPSEWPLIFTDTGVTILRTWLQPRVVPSTAVVTVQGQYLSIGEASVKPIRLFQGLGVATAVVLLTCYISTLTVWHLPTYPNDRVCGKMAVKASR